MDKSTKSINTKGGKNRLRFTSSKSRAKTASADVYRISDSRLLTSATAVREKRVHDNITTGDTSGRSTKKKKKKRRKKNQGKNDDDDEEEEMDDDAGEEEEVRYFGNDNNAEGLGIGRTAVIVSSKSKFQLETPEVDVDDDQLHDDAADDDADADEEAETDALITGGTIFLTELEVSSQRNGSQLYQKLVRALRPLCKSLAELLHHVERIVELLYAYLLSPRGDDGSSDITPIKRSNESWKEYKKHVSTKAPNGYVVNVATNDVLHLFGVLAKELRHEIYPYVTSRILPRIIDDMLNPPTVTIVMNDTKKSRSQHNQQHNNVPLDVSHVEAAFRTISYLFKYNSDYLIHNHSLTQAESSEKQKQQVGDADILRQYYGKTICHKRDIVRRLASEAYAPLLRKCIGKGLKRHLSKTVKALATSLATAVVATTNDESDHMTNSAKRARDDAIDGVSSLLFEVSKGAPGRIHSKQGRLVARTLLDCLISYTSGSSSTKKTNGNKKTANNDELIETNKAEAVYDVASQFLYKLRGHVARRTQNEGGVDTAAKAFVDILDELHRALDTITSVMKEITEEASVGRSVLDCVSGHVIDLMTETINFQEGRLFDKQHGATDRVVNSLQTLLNHEIYSNAGRKLQDQILNYLCSAWRTNPSHSLFALRLGKFFPSIVTLSGDATTETGLNPALFLGQHLLPYLPKKVAATHLIPALLRAAATPSSQNGAGINDSSLVLLQTISTTVWPNKSIDHNANEVDIDDAVVDGLFAFEAAEHCPTLPAKVRSSLFDICMSTDPKQLARVGYSSKCIPFLVCLECSRNDDDGSEGGDEDSIDNSQLELLNRLFKWYSSVLKSLDARMKGGKEDEQGLYIAQSLVLESFSKSVIECHKRLSSSNITSLVKNTLTKAKAFANTLLSHHPSSVWVVKGVAAVTKALSTIDPDSRLNDQSNETFELLVPNLAQANHFLRLYTLQILDGYPSRPFVTDHADLDLRDDLEEEPSYKDKSTDDDNGGNLNADGSHGLSGSCNIISLMNKLESIPVSLPNERKLTSQLNRIEVYARTGKLPIAYAEAVTCHMLGLLHVKFSPIWPAAVKVIVSISQVQEGPAWPHIEKALKQSMMKLLSKAGNMEDIVLAQNDEDNSCDVTKAILQHFEQCIAWETSKGKNIEVFGAQTHERDAQVSRHAVTDSLTLFENIWSIMENASHLTSTKSKVVVPIFFEFLSSQFYVFHQDEPDSREIDLSDLLESSSIHWHKEDLGRKALQKKLEIFLKVFAAVKGPQQLFKHKMLLQIFVSFLANPDAKLSNLAFACVLRFKLPYLTPYIEYVQPMLKREGLREAITKFDLSRDGEIVDTEHRLLLLPIVTRILFGRFSSRGNGANKSAKDSPAARRASILSFFSGIGNDEGELDYFIYMMVRAFIPHGVSMKHHGVQIDKETLTKLIQSSERITAQELTSIPDKRQEGFLNLLSDVITQIGFGVKRFAHTFVNLLLAICEQTEEAYLSNIKNQELKNDTNKNDTSVVEHDASSRIGRIRSLAFLRLANMMTKFASSVDFSKHGERLWKSMSTSVSALPNTVINADNPPSLLQLIEKISSHHKLIPLLHQSDYAVVAVFKCIAGTTRMKVMFTVLRIIDGLLTDGGTISDTNMSFNEQSMGQTLILKHIHMLITQFTNRLTKEARIVNLEKDIGGNFRTANKPSKHSPTEGMQLNILCRVSELLVSAEQASDEYLTTMDDLCSLLVPLLKFDSHPNQLYVARTVNSLIPKLSTADCAMTHFHSLSKLLGPNKNEAGITSNEHRQNVSSAMCAICSRHSGSPKWKVVAQAVTDVNAVSNSRVDEYDFERMLPVLNNLGATNGTEGSWLDLSKISIEGLQQFDGTRVLLPLVYTCFHLLYDSDGVVSRAANKALKCLLTTSSDQTDSDQIEQSAWIKLAETTIVPCLKIGIATKDLSTRRTFVLLISHLARHFVDCKSVHLYGDLRSLIRDDDPELDFFLNVTHVQLHRRGRAFNRLRRVLSAHEESAGDDQSALFSDQSLGNILLPLAIHPVYEYKSKTDEAYVIEAVAAVGEICKHIPWSKYSNTLQSLLNNLPRYPDQERVLIAMLCAIIDAFHFPVETGEETGDSVKESRGNGVWRTLNNRIMPKVESFLVKEKVDKKGYKFKSIRSSVVLALMKLFQKFPTSAFETKLPKLITVVCNALKNKDSNTRDIARETLSRMVVGLDMKYLPLVLTELSVSLSEGYKLHVRAATLHSILVAIAKVYQQPGVVSNDEVVALPFDRCLPAMLDLIHQDVFGKASEHKEAQHVEKRLVKEAMGSKSLDSLEILARIIYFQPSLAAETRGKDLNPTQSSSVHALVTPFLDRLRDPDVSSSTIRKVKECLHRVAVGFSTNYTAKYDEVLPFIYATVDPFVRGNTKLASELDADLENSDDEVEAPIQVSKSSGGRSTTINKTKNEVGKAIAVTTWTPSTLGAAESKRSAYDMKRNQKRALHKVVDGTAAPKLTGSSRHSPLKSSKAKTLNNPANACAVNFGLTLLNSALKRSKLDVSDEKLCAMADPYLHLLTHCVSFSSGNQAVVLSLRCLGVFLRMDLPSVPRAAKTLGPSILDHLTTAGAASNTQSDIVQGCFKTLTLLISHPKFSSSDMPSVDKDTKSPFTNEETLPLNSDQMQALLSLLHSAVREYDHHNSTFGLVKAISSKRFISSEFYDLMDIILKLSVQSQKSNIRLQSSQIFHQYLIDYPMGKQRMDNHLHQVILNLKYEYEDGRLSAIDLLSSIIQKFPLPVLEERCQFFFLPLVLQLVNDDSKKCKESVAGCISLLLQRISTDSVQSLFEYAKRWSQSTGSDSLSMQRASVQLLGIFIDSRADYIKRGNNASDIVSIVVNIMVKQDHEESEWELLYHSLVCTEKMDKQMPSLISVNYDLWGALVKFQVFPHPWVMQVSSRIISSHLSTIDPTKLLLNSADSFVANIPGCLYKLASNSCRQLDVEDVHFVETTSTLAIKTITWAFRAMKQHPDLCYDNNLPRDSNEDSDEEDVIKSKDPCLWVLTRLSNIAKPVGDRRRESIFKCFAALCTSSCDPKHFSTYLELIIDPIDRAIREATNKLGTDDQADTDPQISLSKDVLQILEDTCGTEPFIKAYAEVNRKAREKRDKRKQELASEAVHDPVAAAQRKLKKQLREKDRRKRRVDDRRTGRGAIKKRRH